MKGTIYIYRHKELGKCYVGQTIQPFKYRRTQHLNPNSTCTALRDAIQEYGENAFDIILIENIESREELNRLEILYIKQYNSMYPNGYNLHGGGSRLNAVSDETRKRISEASRNRKHSPETKKKIGRSGESNARAKLSELEVIEIKNRLKKGEKQASIAKSYGVAFQTVSDIKRGKRWKCLMNGKI